jgi:hypothetical protein
MPRIASPAPLRLPLFAVDSLPFVRPKMTLALRENSLFLNPRLP